MKNKTAATRAAENEFVQYHHITTGGNPSTTPEGIKFTAINPCTGRHVLVGILHPTGVFCKQVAEKSKLRVLDAYGIEATVVEELNKLGCKKICLNVDKTDVYEVDFATFYDKAVRRTFGNSSYQYYLPLSYWTKLGGPEQLSFA